uniref:F-box domain-containing protein n=1 Tax=Caenorhabditis tropicalis TaxID=1561998 RepID=A0A1I7U648_9PELO
MSSLNEELSNKVFNNPYLLERIMKYYEYTAVPFLNVRLTSKAFNNACLATIRAEFRVMTIVFEEESDGYRGLKNEIVHLNGHGVKISKISPCFLFLKDVVRLKVEELEVKEIWKLKKTLRKQFHDSIHSDLIGDNHKSIRKLTGLEEACFGCPKCWKFTEYVQEYGPLRFRSLKAIKKPISIRRLIVNDLLLEQIAKVHCGIRETE